MCCNIICKLSNKIFFSRIIGMCLINHVLKQRARTRNLRLPMRQPPTQASCDVIQRALIIPREGHAYLRHNLTVPDVPRGIHALHDFAAIQGVYLLRLLNCSSTLTTIYLKAVRFVAFASFSVVAPRQRIQIDCTRSQLSFQHFFFPLQVMLCLSCCSLSSVLASFPCHFLWFKVIL